MPFTDLGGGRGAPVRRLPQNRPWILPSLRLHGTPYMRSSIERGETQCKHQIGQFRWDRKRASHELKITFLALLCSACLSANLRGAVLSRVGLGLSLMVGCTRMWLRHAEDDEKRANQSSKPRCHFRGDDQSIWKYGSAYIFTIT